MKMDLTGQRAESLALLVLLGEFSVTHIYMTIHCKLTLSAVWKHLAFSCLVPTLLTKTLSLLKHECLSYFGGVYYIPMTSITLGGCELMAHKQLSLG